MFASGIPEQAGLGAFPLVKAPNPKIVPLVFRCSLHSVCACVDTEYASDEVNKDEIFRLNLRKGFL